MAYKLKSTPNPGREFLMYVSARGQLGFRAGLISSEQHRSMFAVVLGPSFVGDHLEPVNQLVAEVIGGN